MTERIVLDPVRDWPMDDWPNEEITVSGYVAALKGCGDNDDPVTIVTGTGHPVRILGVRAHQGAVQIVVAGPDGGAR